MICKSALDIIVLLNTVLLLINAPKAAFALLIYGHGGSHRQHVLSRRSFRDYEKYGLSVAGPRLYTGVIQELMTMDPYL